MFSRNEKADSGKNGPAVVNNRAGGPGAQRAAQALAAAQRRGSGVAQAEASRPGSERPSAHSAASRPSRGLPPNRPSNFNKNIPALFSNQS